MSHSSHLFRWIGKKDRFDGFIRPFQSDNINWRWWTSGLSSESDPIRPHRSSPHNIITITITLLLSIPLVFSLLFSIPFTSWSKLLTFAHRWERIKSDHIDRKVSFSFIDHLRLPLADNLSASLLVFGLTKRIRYINQWSVGGQKPKSEWKLLSVAKISSSKVEWTLNIAPFNCSSIMLR